MASSIADLGKNIALDALATACDWAGVTSDASVEATGGTPAYARKAVTFAAAASGSVVANGTMPVFDVPAGFTAGKLILMSESVGGTTYATYDATDEAFAGQGTYTVTGITLSI